MTGQVVHPQLAFNQITARNETLPAVVEACGRVGLKHVGLWRDKVEEVGLDNTVALVRRAGLQVSSLCRGGFFPATEPAERARRIADNRAAIDEAAALDARVLVLVCGGLPAGERDLSRARDMVRDGIAEIVPHAEACGVRLGIEPLHPMYAADRSVVVTLDEALDIAEEFPPETVGVVVDTFHVWWDPGIQRAIARAGDRIASFQICDWLDPLPDVLLGRGMPGDGAIDFRSLHKAVMDAGYAGPIEVEIFNQSIWDQPIEHTFDQVISTFGEQLG